MPLAKCVRCSRMFNKVESPVCKECQPAENEDGEKVREVVNANPDMGAEEVAEAAGVDIAVVQRMVKEGHLVAVSSFTETVSCGRCGAPAISMSKKLCQACLDKLNAEVARAQASVHLGTKKKVEVGEYDANVRQAMEQKRRE